MLNPEEHRERCSARRRGDRELPRRRGWRLGDRAESRVQCEWRKPARAEVFLGLHGRDDAIHVYADRVGRSDRSDLRVSVPGLKLQLAPARDDIASETKSIAEPPDRGDGFRSEEHTSELQSLRHLV